MAMYRLFEYHITYKTRHRNDQGIHSDRDS